MTDEKSGEILENAAETAVSEESAKAPAKKAESKEPKKASKKPGVFKRFFSFCKEVKSEIKKVVWPTMKQLRNNAVIVVIVVVIIAAFIALFDTLFKSLVGFVA